MLIANLGFGLADGAFLNAIRLSQIHDGLEFDARQLLPKEWIEALLATGLATGSPSLFYVRGSAEFHDWIMKQRSSARTGGQATKRKVATGLATGLAVAGPSSSSSSSRTRIRNIVRLAPDDPSFLEALRAINRELGTNYRPLKTNHSLIVPRLTEGASIQDLVDVARLKKSQWADDPKMRGYLRPKTLYNQTNFESYLAEMKAERERQEHNAELFG